MRDVAQQRDPHAASPPLPCGLLGPGKGLVLADLTQDGAVERGGQTLHAKRPGPRAAAQQKPVAPMAQAELVMDSWESWTKSRQLIRAADDEMAARWRLSESDVRMATHGRAQKPPATPTGFRTPSTPLSIRRRVVAQHGLGLSSGTWSSLG